MSANWAVMPKSDYTAACNAIRTKKSTQNLIKSGDMAQEILSIPTGKDEETFFAELLAEEWGTAAYTITSTLSNATIYQVLVDGVAVPSLPATINAGSSLSVVFATSTHYTMDGAVYSGTMGNTSLANNYQYDSVNDRLNLNIADVEGNISISVSAALREYTITGAITNGALDPQYDSTITYGATAYFGILPNTNYTYPAQSAITVTGATITAYDSTTGVGTIANPTGNVTITATCPASAVTYTLTNTLSNVTVTSVDSTKYGTLAEIPAFVYDDDTLTIQFTADSGYNLPSSVTVNSYSVPENTATATYGTCAADYGTTSTTGTITLTSFTGAVSFSVTAQSGVITDLTGTKWEITSTTCTAGYGHFNVGEMTVDDVPYGFAAASLWVGYRFRDGEMVSTANTVYIMGQIIQVTVGTIIEFTGSGTDSTNTDLISWIQSHATQMPYYSTEVINDDELPDPNDNDDDLPDVDNGDDPIPSDEDVPL